MQLLYQHWWLTPVANLPPASTTPVANLPPESTTPAANFATSTAGVVDTGGKFTNYHRCQRHRRQIFRRCLRYLQQIFRRCQPHWWQIAAGINDTSAKFGEQYQTADMKEKFIYLIFFICHQCQRLPWCTLSCEYLSKLSKIRNGPNGILRGLGKLIHKKAEVENLVALSL
jgi:hypothetical protein